MKELDNIQKANLGLRSELDVLKSLLEEEEEQMSNTRMQSPLIPHPSHPLTNSFPSSMYSAASEFAKSCLLDSSETFTPLNSGDSSETLKSSTSAAEDKHSEHRESLQRMDPPPLLNGLSLGEGEVRDSITSMKKTSSSKIINKNSHQADTDHKSATASSLGNLKIAEVNGKFVRIINASPEEEEDIGGYILQQNVCGHPVSVYRFPPKIRITAGCAVTVWAATANAPHNPPSDFLWKELKTFITERRCTTILSNANGHVSLSSFKNKMEGMFFTPQIELVSGRVL
ncbi:Hypothetical predicted protein [Pelobates cultripes]|uniref:LTD domain-containing protein n=1 Tax=Pelobates cultripes TaxID=61616 RepID=A0AAD1W2F5_PELCU|nr:Hypothetical predicted protein [Pelobates cultripes]